MALPVRQPLNEMCPQYGEVYSSRHARAPEGARRMAPGKHAKRPKPRKGDICNQCLNFRAQASNLSWNPGFQSPLSQAPSPWTFLQRTFPRSEYTAWLDAHAFGRDS